MREHLWNIVKLTSVMALAAASAIGCGASVVFEDAETGSVNNPGGSLIAPVPDAPVVPQPAPGASLADSAPMLSLDINANPVNKVVCDPFDGDDSQQINGGLTAKLYYMRKGDKGFTRVSDVLSRGHLSSQKLFFSKIETPTRMFSSGFTSESGELLKNDDNEVLIENFGLSFTSILKLAPNQEEGLYEFAILSDDGAILRLRDESGKYREVVNNDGNHPTRMGCSSQFITLNRSSEVPMQLDYYQGPRFHIALMVLMRKVQMGADGQIARDSLCGMTSNDAWFDLKKNSAPKKPYKDLLARGWQPLSKDNYGLPNVAQYNPCVAGVVPKISNLRLVEASNSSLWITWDTDVMATSQVMFKGPGDKESKITASDNRLRKSHSVIVKGLNPGTLYHVQAVSISDSLGKAISQSIDAETEY